MNLLCRLGLHKMDSRTETAGFGLTVIVDDYNRCTRPGCKYFEWFFVNRETRVLPEKGEGCQGHS